MIKSKAQITGGLDIGIEFNNITLLNSTWKIHGLNLLMKKADLAQAQLYMEKGFRDKEGKFVQISNSTFGSLITTSEQEIAISDSNIDGTTRLNKTFLDITNSNLTIIDSKFHNLRSNTGPVIKVVASQIKLQDVKISESSSCCNLIEILNDSEVIVTDSTFQNNQNVTIILVTFNSSANISNSKFVRNSGQNSHCISYGQNSTVYINKSSFLDNNYLDSAVISTTKQSQLRSRISCRETKFVNNTWQDFKGTLSDASFDKCIFTKWNYLAIRTTQANVEITSSNFSGSAGIHADVSSTIGIYDSYIQLKEAIFSIRAEKNSSLVVAHSQFYNCGNYTFVIYLSSSLEVSDTVFKSSQLLSIFKNSQAKFTNSIFKGTRGSYAESQSNISIMNSTITYCATDYPFLKMSDRCHLHISDSYITDNKLNMTNPFVNIDGSGTMALSNCLYARNNMPRHLVASSMTNVTIIISNSYFVNNTGNILAIHQGTIIVQTSVFNNNSAPESDLISLESMRNAQLVNCHFAHNNALTVLHVSSYKTFPINYLKLYNCSFENNTIFTNTVIAVNVGNVIIDEVFLQKMGIINVQTVRIQDSIFSTSDPDGKYQISFLCNQCIYDHCPAQLLTLQSQFSRNNKTLSTNATDFLRRAESMDLIAVDEGCTLEYEETKYTSSKQIIQY